MDDSAAAGRAGGSVVIYLVQAVRTVLRRIGPDWPVVATAAVTVLVGTVQLAAVPIYTEAVTVGAMHRILGDAPAGEATLDVGLATAAGVYDVADSVVTDVVDEGTAVTGSDISRRLRSESFAFEGRAVGGRVDLVVLQAVEGIERHATIVEGAWPGQGRAAGSDRIAAALEVAVADRLGLAVGAVVELTGRRNGATILVEITGRYRVDDRTSRFWAGDELLVSGSIDGRRFRTSGPLVVGEAAMLAAPTGRLRAEWHVEPRLDRLSVEEISALRRSLDQLSDRVNDGLDATGPGASGTISDAEVTTSLPALLAGTERSLTVTRSGVFAVVLQLGVLAGLALAISGSLLVDTRRRERELLRARGAGRAHLVVLSVVEACLLVLPAAIAGPWVAAALVGALETAGPLAGIGLDLDPSVGGTAYTTVALVALAMIGVLTWPAIRASRAVAIDPTPGRQDRRAQVSRVGVDLALVALVVLAFWQLSVLGTERTALIGDRLAVDPVLMAAPALALLAGAVTSLRLLPLIAGAGERRVHTSRSPATALTGWQLARRPAALSRPAFLLVMAFGIGIFAATYAATWNESQGDQATHSTGADLWVAPNRRTGDSITDLYLVAAHEQLDGVTASMPVMRTVGVLPGSDRNARLLAIDADRARRVVRVRDDLAPDFSALMETLLVARPEVPGIDLPGDLDQLLVKVRVEESEIESADGDVLPPAFGGRLALTLRDANDLLHRIELGELSAGDHRLEADLTAPFVGGATVGPAHPLSLVEIEIRSPVPSPPSREVTVDLGLATVTSATTVPAVVPLSSAAIEWSAVSEVSSGLRSRQRIAVEAPPSSDGIVVAIDTGATSQSSVATFTLRPGPAPSEAAVPVVVSRSWLESTRRQVGDSLTLPGLVPDARLEIAGVVDGFPTVDPNTEDVAVVDLPTALDRHRRTGRPIPTIDEQWLTLEAEASEAAVEAALFADPFDSVSVIGRQRRADQLRTDPAALATIAAYTVGYGAAAIFAVVVFAVTAVMATRDRRSEIALLRAMGLSSRQLGTWQIAEHTVLVAASLLIGVGIGLTLSAVALPLVAVSQEGGAVVPTVRPVYPWATLAAVELVPLVVLTGIVSALVARLRRLRLADLLRMGED